MQPRAGFKLTIECQQCWHTPLIPALRRQRQVDVYEFEASLVYRSSSRTARATQKNPALKKKKEEESAEHTQNKPSLSLLMQFVTPITGW